MFRQIKIEYEGADYYVVSRGNAIFMRFVLVLFILLSGFFSFGAENGKEGTTTEGGRFDPVEKKIEGWTVYVEPALLEGPHKEEGDRALEMLGNHLQRITILLPEDRLKKSGKYENVLLYTGQNARHYAMTDQKEYFAEGTESYFGRNDFYPFVRAELQEHDPELHDILKDIWGSVE